MRGGVKAFAPYIRLCLVTAYVTLTPGTVSILFRLLRHVVSGTVLALALAHFDAFSSGCAHCAIHPIR